MRTGWERAAATGHWLPSDGEGTQLTGVHFRKGLLAYADTLYCLGGLRGPLLLMLASDLATALRCELDDYREVRVGRKAVISGNLVALHRPAGAGGHRRNALMPHLDSHNTYVSAAWGTLARNETNLSRPSRTTGCSLLTHGGGRGEDAQQRLPALRPLPRAGATGLPL